MKEKKEFKLSYLAAHFTTIVSVTLVLLMIGIIAMAAWGASRETRRLQEQIEVSVVLADTVTNASAQTLATTIAAMPCAGEVKVISSQQAMQEWNAEEDTDLEEVLGVNPFSPEIAFTVKADYASPDSIAAIATRLRTMPDVEDVAVPDATMVADMNRHIQTLTAVLGIIALVMLIISFVLINNTVHLSIYARRFSIHTMQLVGATDGFIRAPFLRDNLCNGLLAGVIASVALGGLLAGAEAGGLSSLTSIVGWGAWGVISAGMVIIGSLICVSAAAIATRRYLHTDYDELFKQ